MYSAFYNRFLARMHCYHLPLTFFRFAQAKPHMALVPQVHLDTCGEVRDLGVDRQLDTDKFCGAGCSWGSSAGATKVCLCLRFVSNVDFTCRLLFSASLRLKKCKVCNT